MSDTTMFFSTLLVLRLHHHGVLPMSDVLILLALTMAYGVAALAWKARKKSGVVNAGS